MIIFGRGQRVMPEGEYPGMHIASLTVYGCEPFGDAAMVDGHLYIDVMRHLVGPFHQHGYVAGDARIQVINGPIGIMLRDLRLSFSIFARRRAFRHWSR